MAKKAQQIQNKVFGDRFKKIAAAVQAKVWTPRQGAKIATTADELLKQSELLAAESQKLKKMAESMQKQLG